HTEGYRSYVAQYGYDGGILAYAVLAWTLWILGYPERARDTCNQMLAIAERTANRGAVAAVLAYAANVARECRDLESVLQLTNRIMSFGRAWAAPALCTQGWAMAQRGEVEEGIAKMRQGLSRFQRAGLQGTYDYHRTALVDALLLRGEVEEALPLVRDGFARCPTPRAWRAKRQAAELPGASNRRADSPQPCRNQPCIAVAIIMSPCSLSLPVMKACTGGSLPATRRRKSGSASVRVTRAASARPFTISHFPPAIFSW